MKSEKHILRYKDDIEAAYSSILANYAAKVPCSGSRRFCEEEGGFENRSSFQRDRDRIIHSSAFRRMMYKTQVFVNHEGDHFRTRLTHSLEVAQFARGIAKSLALNEDLAEAIALGHDLGHTPFGHAAESVLSAKLKADSFGGFFHNEQSVRVVDLLDVRDNDIYSGLNLTFEVDEFYGQNQGLTIAEIELKDVAEEFCRPNWLGREVTGERRFYNSRLREHPFSEWSDEEKE